MTVQAGRLPEHARRAPGHLHYSFKYSGKCQGVSACTFVDERDLFWHSLVFSAAERESAYVIGGIMRNAVVKSDIHSTGTHGFSEAIFVVTHPVGNQLRSPHQESEKAEPPYVPVTPGRRPCQPDDKPARYVDPNSIVTDWDDVPRLVATIIPTCLLTSR